MALIWDSKGDLTIKEIQPKRYTTLIEAINIGCALICLLLTTTNPIFYLSFKKNPPTKIKKLRN